jgi:ABC-2 type transport system permease protein
MGNVGHLYLRWLRDRRRSTITWSLSLGGVVALTAAFYPALQDMMSDLTAEDSSGISSLMGLDGSIDPSSPLGFVWSNLYANVVPMTLIALGISLGCNAIAGDEEGGTLEYLLSKPVRRSEVLLARFGGMVTILFVVAVASGLALLATAPFVGLTDEMVATAADGTEVVHPGIDVGDVAAGTVSAFAVGLGSGALAFLLGAATGRKGLSMAIASGIAVAGYLLYTLSNVTDSLEWTTWLSPWRWYMADAMLIDGLTPEVLLPVVLALLCQGAAMFQFVRRDLQS